MGRIQNFRVNPVLIVVFVLLLGLMGYAQGSDKASQTPTEAKTVQVPVGQKMNVEGVILNHQGDSLTLRSVGGAAYTVAITDYTEVKEKKSNFFRGAKKYAKSDLVPGLFVEVKGEGSSSGSISAREIRLRNDDFIVAQTMDARVVPVESQLRDTQARLGETEENAQRLSGQVQELSELSNLAKNNAKVAQESADNAMSAANNAKSLANTAEAGVHAANERITSLDEYTVKNSTTVHFKAGSAALSNEDKTALEQFAEQIKGEKGFLIEVAGFASSDGDEAFNRRLSQRRADAVIQYLAESYAIPLRRFVTPMGYGETQPVGDNQTHEGREENRRVEVRILVTKGLAPAEGSANYSINKPETSQLQ